MTGGGGGGGELANGCLPTPRNSEKLLEMLHTQLGGNPEAQVPLSTLNELTRHVATISKRRPPQLAVQKRGFVKNYYADLVSMHGGGSGGGGGGGGAPVSAEGVYREVDARLKQAQRSVTGTGNLADVHIDSLAEKVRARDRNPASLFQPFHTS